MPTKNLSIFCERNEKYKQRFSSEDYDKLQRDRILEILCEFLMQPECTKDVAECFPQLLPALILMAIFTDDVQSSTLINNDLIHRLNCVILGKLVDINPHLLEFVLHYFDTNPAPFEPFNINDSSSSTPSKKQNIRSLSCSIVEVSEYDIVAATYSILQSAINHFKHKWTWSIFYKYLTNADDKIKWIAINCMAIILDLSESAKLSCAEIFIPTFKQFQTYYDDTNTNADIYLENIESTEQTIKNVPSIVSVADILLPTCGKSQKTTHNLISVPSTMKNLQSLAIALGSKKCICLQGPVGCGKTALVEYLAGITGHDASNFVKVQLGDQTDSKMLLGMYRCTDMPGEFVWQPGVLTQAVIAGKWLLLEDVDSAPQDVISVLSNLMETGTLCVPGYRDTVYANSGFQLFVTQRLMITATGIQKHVTGSSNLLQKHWLCLNVEPLSKNELVTIVQTLFPVLNTVATRIVDVFLLFSVGNHDNDSFASDSTLSLKIERQTSTRDLIKWCSRVIINFNVSSPICLLKVFQDALDVFCYSIPDEKYRLKLAKAVSNILGIRDDKAEYYCNVYKPTISLSSKTLVAGRAKLLCKKAQYATMMKTKSTNFSFTKSSSCLLERIAGCVAQKEPVLLVGETGTGKTSVIQYLAENTGHKLMVINMNQQSESTDLLGGYKPVDLKFLISPIYEKFEFLFRSFFNIALNEKYLEAIAMLHEKQKWNVLVPTMRRSVIAAVKRLMDEHKKYLEDDTLEHSKQKGHIQKNQDDLNKWKKILDTLNKLQTLIKNQCMLAFSFIEGSLVKALKQGYWILLDEINLANAETLDCLSGLLEGSSESIALLERGDGEPVKRHPDFTIFACMNPATDVGKRDLPVGLRNRFTEFYVNEMTEANDLRFIVNSYLANLNVPIRKHEAIVQFYLNVRKKAIDTLYDGIAHKPHYSLRTLCRALRISASNPCGNVLRSLYEAFSLSFLTQLNFESYPIVQEMIESAIADNKNIKAFLNHRISEPANAHNYALVEGYWILRGSLISETPSNYVLTKTVRRNLRDLARIVSIGKIPVLLQGDTSVGKTSLIVYLARITNHVCLRINNHEHTDLQEYIGSYVSDEHGKLVFKEGILVNAMRKGYWIILDELNLAPSDVLEALNRVLDDNRELFIPETQQVVKAHEHFMLFATQNPAGIYGGRKILSRAFKNRFVELHFDEIPPEELETILAETCQMPQSYCKQIIKVMTELQTIRKSTTVFAGKKGFMTLRDLFRWGRRYALASNITGFYDWNQHLADEGYLVLAAKVRKAEEANDIRQVIKKHMKRDVDPDRLFTLNDKTSPVTKHILEEILNNDIPDFGHIVWTYHMRRMAVLVKKSCQFKEPVLLVGETGGGKTTICQLIAAMNKQTMRSINCHMHTESSDFLGNLRPVREHSKDDPKLFEWVDGPLIDAMRNGDLFLADEISLADDSVLERLNSLLESERSLLLAEKGIESHSENSVIKADESFMFIGTMNPGGDYGKKELSPALRNRFTEIWCEGCTTRDDLHDIIMHNLRVDSQTMRESVATAILRFTEWLHTTDVGKKLTVSIRDMLTWVEFMNTCTSDALIPKLTLGEAYYHGACLTYIDSLGSGCTGSETINKLNIFAQAAVRFVRSEVEGTIKSGHLDTDTFKTNRKAITDTTEIFGVPPFYIKKGPNTSEDYAFTFNTPTTKLNTLKLLRALQLSKPILLEGSPGVGKTSLVTALAKAAGHTLLRINLSDQTDISDLFGTDLPVEGGKGGEFAWRDGSFLRALRAGYWILLDELNLASQSVLEGLNACFDHRGEVYIPELAKTFSVKPGTRLFACQNPLRQGGARRGLPKSFLNRFTQVFMDTLMENDLKLILNAQFPQLPMNLLNDMVQFHNRVASETGVKWGFDGSPWEFNLRDITRWCEATIETGIDKLRDNQQYFNPGDSVELVYANRMRTTADRQKIYDIYQEIFSPEKYPLPPKQLPMHITKDNLFIYNVTLSRQNCSTYEDCMKTLLVLRNQKMVLKSLMQCIKMNWMSILIGASGCGKSNVVRLLAVLIGQKLKSISMNSAMDTMEILGGFEQTDYNRHLEQLFKRVTSLVITSLRMKLTEKLELKEKLEQTAKLHEALKQVQRLFDENITGKTMDVQVDLFLNKITELSKLASKMKLWEPCYESELLDIESNLKELSDLVTQDKCLNAGGKFEWVDSVLVKCLKDGTWLLIDQVNLCSPAVLDRLNGLLEPNGVLTIGERGVDEEGNVVTIKPHKNFRLFLTMDPRYGELSRAMRNRGVEIYMLGPKENVDYDPIDLQSLLFNAGIARSAQRSALLDIYRGMSAEIAAMGHLSVLDLSHTAFLVRQRTLRGFPAGQSIRDACIDVYIKTRTMPDRIFKERLITLIDEAIERHVARNEEQTSVIDLDAATWSVSNLQKNPRLTIIRQQSLLLNAIIKIYVSDMKSGNSGRDIATTKLLNDFCNLKEDEEFTLIIDIADALPHFLLNFFEQSSQDDVQLRKAWISDMLRQNAVFGDFEKKVELMAKVIASFSFRNSSLPWNLWQLVGKRVTYDGNDSTCSDANKLLLLLYTYSMVLENDVILTEDKELKNKKIISVKQYSNFVHKGKLSSRLKNQPLVTHFVEIVRRANSFIAMILQVYDVTANSEEYVELRKGLMWYTRFVKLGEMPLKKSEKSKDVFVNLEQISLLLKVHYKWLLKFLRKLLTIVERSSRDANPLEVEQMVNFMDVLNSQLGSVYDLIKKISKRIKKHLPLPLPHSSEICMNIHSELRNITQKLDARDKGGSTLTKNWRIVAVQLDDPLAIRHRTISLSREVHSGRPIDTTTWQTILEMKQLCESHIRLPSSEDNESIVNRIQSLLPKAKMTQLNMKTQLWPIYEYLFMSLACTMQREMCQNGTISAETAEYLAGFADLPNIPIDLISLLDTMARSEVEQKQKIMLLPELFHRLAQFAQRSYAVMDPSELLQWHGITAEEDEGISGCTYTESKVECYFGGPVLFNLMLQLLLSKTNQEKEKNVSSAVTLGTYAAKMNQLQLLNEILWRNSISLTSKRYNLISNDLVTLKYYLRLYMSAIDKMNTEYNVRDLIAIAMKKQGTRAVDVEHKLQVDYFQPLEELRKACDEINTIDEENAGEEENILQRGRTWMSLGYFQLLLFGNLDLIDPIHKVELKLKYLEEDIIDCKKTMYVATLQNRILGMSAEDEYAHPKLAATKDCEMRLRKTRDDLSYLKAFRPSSVNFASLSKENTNFRNEVASCKLVEKHASNLCTIARKIRQNCDSADLMIAETAVREAESWSLSVEKFAEQIEIKYLSAYPDVIIPLLTALTQLKHGVCILINEIRRLISLRKSTVTNLEFLIYNLLRFPTIGPQQDNLSILSSLCASSAREVSENLRSTDAFVRMREQFRIFKSGLHEMHNHIILNRGLTKSLWRNVNELLQQIVLIWKQQQQEEEKRATERDNLYKNKIKSHTSTEEDDELALIHMMFPTQHEKDFDDIEKDIMPSLNGNNALAESNELNEAPTLSGLITKDDIKDIQQIHSNIVTTFITSKWICNSSSVSKCSTNYIGPLVQRYDTVRGMVKDILPSLSDRLATKLYNSLNLLVALELQANQDESMTQPLWENPIQQTTKAYNFYNDCNIEEVKQCLPVCQSILNHVDELLKQWPENPILRSIQCIIERIYAFPTVSPVSRFLTGLELLLEKMQQWDQFAHRGIRMVHHITALTQQILSWRKLELSCWKAYLDTVYEDLRSDTSKWWFFLYALIESYVTRSTYNETANDEQSITREKLVESLQRFMTESSLVEFEARLNLLLTFHCHVYYLNDNSDKDEILAVLWNVYNYYKQFVDDVKTRIATLKAPIETKLKDIIKIIRWTGMNHWAIKKSVEATHRQLHKYVKEFQNALKQSVSTCLIVRSGSYSAEMSKGVWDDQDHHDPHNAINPDDFIVAKSPQFSETKTLSTSELITRTETLLVKAKKLCKEIILVNSYSCIRSELEDFIQDFMEQSARLRNLDIDKNLPKDKQKSQAKSILQQKKMTLANYFKMLTQIGISYRAGALTLKNNASKVIDLTTPPLDLSRIDQYFNLKNTDQHMLKQWKSCEKYYYKSLIRLNALNAMFSRNQTDLGLQNIERCRGYSAHMMLMAHKQKTTIAQSFDRFSSLRIELTNLSEASEQDLTTSKQCDGQKCAESLKTLLITIEHTFEQLLGFLQCCPVESSMDPNKATLTLHANALPIIAGSQNDEAWKNANVLLKDGLNSTKTLAERLRVLFMPFYVLSGDRSALPLILSSKHFKFLEQSCITIEDIRIRCQKLKQLFTSTDIEHPVWENIEFLDTKMEYFLHDFDHLRKFAEIDNEERLKETNNTIEQYELALEHLINIILLVIQKKYKYRINKNNDATRINEDSTEKNNEDDIEENVLKEKLVDSLEKDITELKLSKISDSFFSLLLSIRELDLQSANYCTGLLLKCLPLLEQYILLAQFYLNEQVASFRVTCKMLYLQLNVFLDLAANGFCVPKHLDLEEGETDESGKKEGGMGLADGEGTKDVSDRIESEDQLEDARPADQEQEKQEDKTCKEEEKGIDMSEDFDSQLQDLEKGNEDEEQSDDNDENDLDKEMGETGEGAEQLDKEIWDNDKEESDDDNQQPENEDEKEGTGEQTGEKKLTAKDDKDRKGQHDDDTDENQQEDSKKEINEMNEPEINEDQIDPYYGKFEPQPEPEPLDLPKDLNLDGDDNKEDDDGLQEENPFDIDEMKESNPLPQEKDVKLDEEAEDKDDKENDSGEESSENENENGENVDKDEQNTRDELEANKENEEKNGENTETGENEEDEKQNQEEMEDEKLHEKAAPSANDASQQMDAAQPIEETTKGSRDAVAQEQSDINQQQQDTATENTQEDSNDNGNGQSQSAQQQDGHSGSSKQEIIPAPQRNTTQPKKNNKPSRSNEDHNLLDRYEPLPKKLKTLYTQEEVSKNEKEDDPGSNSNETEMAQHIHKDSKKFDDYTLDAATEDQLKQQASNEDKENENQEEDKDEVMDVEMHEDEQADTANDKVTEQKPEKVSESTNEKQRKDMTVEKIGEDIDMETPVELEGETTEMPWVRRGNESTLHVMECNLQLSDLTSNHVDSKRSELERILSEWTQMPSTEEAIAMWNNLCSITDTAARDLSEKLRLVLEPTQASRLKGDYKTGKRINMRKIIPYIASKFRKDKIWLRRTKPSKRDYQIILAIDDSNSMSYNESNEMTFESLSLISKAMTYLEVGQLGIISFGEEVKLLHPLGETFTEQSGARIVQELKFKQLKTVYAGAINFTMDMFENQHGLSDSAKLMIILSDGRGIYSEGKEIVNSALRRARMQNIFLIFIIVENPTNKFSVLDIIVPIFEESKVVIQQYMDSFPFPFYVILRDINALPSVLSDALRQWFEIVGKSDS